MKYIKLSMAFVLSVFMVGNANADQQILDDLIVDGSVCAGQDCVNGESFGFDTLRLKENNLRIKFQDTSSSASFPTNDWQLTANDSSNGGANKFSIDDIDGGRTPFTIEAGAPSNTLYVDSTGRVGIKKANPVVQLHIVDGNTPTVRLEQDGSSGFTPQTWDMAGNEANFFIRDATNGSTLPFRVFPGAPSDALSIAASGNVGLGTTSPDSGLDIEAAAPELRFTSTVNSSGGGLGIWELGEAGDASFKISHPGAGPAVEIRINREGLFHINHVDSPPVSNLALGAMYNDSSGALCWYDGTAWQKVIGTGTCD